MAFEIRITEDAEQDALAILEWLSKEQAGDAGSYWFLKLKDAIFSLAELPMRCRLAPESESFPIDVRELLYGRRPHVYRILFTVEAETVVVLHIRHGRRKALSAN